MTNSISLISSLSRAEPRTTVKMFSAIKKAFGRDEEAGKGGAGQKSDARDSSSGLSGCSPGIQQMDTSLQRKFARGIQYNSKIKRDGIEMNSKIKRDCIEINIRLFGLRT